MLLLLAGTSEARKIAKVLAQEKIPVLASLAGVTRDPVFLAIKTRQGGYGGAGPFAEFLKDNSITAILDATHPFAAKISLRSARVAAEAEVPYLQLLRAPWSPQPGDLWTMIDNETDAASHIPAGSTVFLATGRKTLPRFKNMAGRRLICRQIDPPDGPFPFENGQYLVGRPPFSVPDEAALFKNLKVDWLVVKNAGGQASRSKLDAARALEIPVAMISRPIQPNAEPVRTIDAAMDWVRGLPW